MIHNTSACDMGIIGLGVMGRNLLLNMAEHGFTVAGYDKDLNQVNRLKEESQSFPIHDTHELNVFIGLLKRPRAILILVPAGPPVDAVINDLLPYLEAGDLIIDAGNSYFKDTDLRTQRLKAYGIEFLGTGISGGEKGARTGASIMPGGSEEAYARIRPVLEAISAKVNGEPCITYIGSGSSGHYVKMVHNGIEYGIMQLISETYDFMKRGMGFKDNELSDVYRDWGHGELNGYLMEITSQIFKTKDDKTNDYLIDKIKDAAQQKGTGMWTVLSAMELQVPTPTINVAVTMRDLSAYKEERLAMHAIYPNQVAYLKDNRTTLLKQLENALFTAIIIVYAEGMSLLKCASKQYNYHLDLASIIKIWRGGCIIRMALLEEIHDALQAIPNIDNLLLSSSLSEKIKSHQADLRSIVCMATTIGIPMPGLMNALNYFDALRSQQLPTNLIQAQRDCFGSHGYQRIDMTGSFHTEWEQK